MRSGEWVKPQTADGSNERQETEEIWYNKTGAARSAGSRVVLPNPSRLLSVVPAVCRLPLNPRAVTLTHVPPYLRGP